MSGAPGRAWQDRSASIRAMNRYKPPMSLRESERLLADEERRLRFWANLKVGGLIVALLVCIAAVLLGAGSLLWSGAMWVLNRIGGG